MDGKGGRAKLSAPMVRRRRLRRAFTQEGTGVHGGSPGAIRAEPAAWGQGLSFAVGGVEIPVDLDFADPEPGCTVLRRDGAAVRTPEHLLAALVGAGVTDGRLVLDGDEVPILDGSALPWWEAITGARVEDGPEIGPTAVEEPVSLAAFGGEVTFLPDPRRVVAVEVDYPGGPSGAVEIDLADGGFARVAAARTFVLERDIAAAVAQGRGSGANAENTVVWGPNGPLGPLRCPDEPVRHKLIDATGDLALLGGTFRGRFQVRRGSHRLHVAALRVLRLGVR